MKTTGEQEGCIETNGITWARGLHRLFIVLSVAWAGFLLVAIPLDYADQAQRHAVLMSNIYLSDPTNDPEVLQERRQEQDLLWQHASLPYVLKHRILPELHWLVLGMALPPVFLYLFVFFSYRLLRWLYRGFSEGGSRYG